MRNLILVCLLLLGMSIFADENHDAAQWTKKVYKSTNPQGVVEFSDIPNKNSEEVIIPPTSTYTPIPYSQKPSTLTGKDNGRYKYNSLKIVSPVADQTIRHNTGMVVVQVIIDPVFQKNLKHRLEVLLDGKPHGGKTGSLSLKNVHRGSHTLQARVLDKEGHVLISSSSVTFQMRRFSTLFKSPKSLTVSEPPTSTNSLTPTNSSIAAPKAPTAPNPPNPRNHPRPRRAH